MLNGGYLRLKTVLTTQSLSVFRSRRERKMYRMGKGTKELVCQKNTHLFFSSLHS